MHLSNIYYAKHSSISLIQEVQNIVYSKFNRPIDYYVEMTVDDYRAIVRETQDLLNEQEYVRGITQQIESDIKKYLQEDSFLIQTNLYFRAPRPFMKGDTESIGWHRETFYGANMEKSINIWTPISNVGPNSTLRYIPLSQEIPEDKISLSQVGDPITKKGSDGHIVGFLYAPKKIIGGVDLTTSEPMNVPEYHSSIFPGNLIHGAAKNSDSTIRFSVDYRILPLSAYDPLKSKKFHVASYKQYFEVY